jgi:cysteine synthase
MQAQDTETAQLGRGEVYANAALAVGRTPLIRLDRLSPEGGAEILLKMEMSNPLASVKDRIGRAMIEAGEADGSIAEDTEIIEPTSGNTGIALAFICAAKGYRLTLCMPESMSLERRAVLKHFGAQLVLTPPEKGMPGAVERANQLRDEWTASGRKVFVPQQFDNPANPRVHEETTGPEIWADTSGEVHGLVAGVGTGGTITGVTRFMRRQMPSFQAIAVEPVDSPVISGGDPGPHKIQGIGAGFIPRNLDVSLLNGVEQVSNDDAFAWGRKLAREEGIFGGISTGANVCAAVRIARRPEMRGKRLVTIGCSFGERYLSTPLVEKDG